MSTIVLFIPLGVEIFAFTLLQSMGMMNAAVGIVLYSLFFEILICPITIMRTFNNLSIKKRSVKATIAINVAFIVASLLLSIIGIYATTVLPEALKNAFEFSETELTNVFTLFGVDLRESGFKFNWSLLIPVAYFVIAFVPDKIKKKRAANKNREEIMKNLSDEDKAMYLEEETKMKKKINIKDILLSLLPLYIAIISVFIARFIVLYWLFCVVWKYGVNFVLKKMLHKKIEAKKVAKDAFEKHQKELPGDKDVVEDIKAIENVTATAGQ